MFTDVIVSTFISMQEATTTWGTGVRELLLFMISAPQKLVWNHEGNCSKTWGKTVLTWICKQCRFLQCAQKMFCFFLKPSRWPFITGRMAKVTVRISHLSHVIVAYVQALTSRASCKQTRTAQAKAAGASLKDTQQQPSWLIMPPCLWGKSRAQ